MMRAPVNAADDLTAQDRFELGKLIENTPLGERIVALKVWLPDGAHRLQPQHGNDRALLPYRGWDAHRARGQHPAVSAPRPQTYRAFDISARL
ncbi:hypothetical protein CYJ10_16715 [Cupriavidus pauculus]|uniref:Uncharacterized protein n=1 Tax=Cupriavidus pauculus TaxID=82633 RepID=A0A2N5CB74_9BURK|nr:hypothetical protein CYJ10_16715 [Cupriavidus pauculus]